MNTILLKQSATYFAGRILPALVGLGGTIVYTRLLDPASVGRYAVLLSIALFFSGLGYSWLRVAVLRDLSAGTPKDGDICGIATTLFVFSSGPVAIGIYVIATTVLSSGIEADIWVTIAVAVAYGWFEFYATILQARMRSNRFALANCARALTTIAFSVIAIELGLTSSALLLGLFLGNAVILTVSPIHPMWRRRNRGGRLAAGKLLRFGWPASLSFGLAQASVAFDRFLITALAGSASTGIYAVSYDMSRQSIGLLLAAINLAGLPLAFRNFEANGPDGVRGQLSQNAIAIMTVGLPATAGIVMLGSSLANSLLGAAFHEGAGTVIGLAGIATFLNSLRTFYFDHAFEMTRRTRPQAVISTIGTVAGILGSLVLVPLEGATGAAISAIGAAILGLGISIHWGRKVFIMPVPTVCWLCCGAATAAMVLVLSKFPAQETALWLVMKTTVGALVYGAALSVIILVFQSRIRLEFSG